MPSDVQVSYLLQYGELPLQRELERWDLALRRHSALPTFVENAVAELPHDAHFMGIILTAINALSTAHPEQNPALAGQNVYDSKDIQDKQILRLIGDEYPPPPPLPFTCLAGKAKMNKSVLLRGQSDLHCANLHESTTIGFP